jgi:SHS2 domain-containing protein
MQFEILEHPADIGFRARGATLAELFENSASAMLAIAYEAGAAKEAAEYPIEASGDDYESLLVNFLSEVLYLADGRQIAFARFSVREPAPGRVAATGFGEPRDPVRHLTRLVVKAVTYHQLRVAETDSGWIAEVYLDI